MAAQQVGGVAVWAHTGRGLLLNDEQRASVLADWRAALPSKPVICGVGVPRGARLKTAAGACTHQVIDETVRLAREARDGGAAAVMVHPPTALRSLRDLDGRVIDLHCAVASVGLPVLAFYLYEAAGGISYAPETVGQLLSIEGVVGIKLATLDSVMTYQDVAKVVKQMPGALLITGEDRFLGYSLMAGAQCALIGMAAACTDVMVELMSAWIRKDLPRFHALSAPIDRFAEATFRAPMEGYVQRMLWALEADGMLQRARDPWAPQLAKGEREQVVEAVRALRAS